MADTAKLGTVDSVLGKSLILGLGAGALSGTQFEVSATSVLAATQLVDQFGTHYKSASSTLALLQSATYDAIQPWATSSIVLTHSVTVGRPLHRSASSALVFTQTVSNQWTEKSASSVLTLTQLADASGPLPRSATSLLELTDTAKHHAPLPVAASSTLALTQSSVQSGPLPRSASSTLELTQDADNNVKQRSVSSAIVVNQTATAAIVHRAFSVIELTQTCTQGILTLSATSELVLSSTSRNTNIREVIPATVIELTQEVTTNIKMVYATSELELAQSLDVRKPIYANGTSELTTYEEVFDPSTVSFITLATGITHSVSLTLIQGQRVHHYIQWTSHANGYVDYADGIVVDAESVLSLSHDAWDSRVGTASSQLNLSHLATQVLSSNNPESVLDLSHEATFNVERAEATVESIIALQQAVRFVHEKSNTHCLYSPFIGSTTDPNAPTPPPATLPEASELTGFRLLYPSTGTASDELVLRAPNLGNIDRLGMDRINRETRGGTLVIFADPIWPKVQTLVLSFSVLKRDEARDLLTFMRSHIGQEIRMIDWENRAWTGVIVNPQDPIVEDSQNSFSASFEFEGARE